MVNANQQNAKSTASSYSQMLNGTRLWSRGEGSGYQSVHKPAGNAVRRRLAAYVTQKWTKTCSTCRKVTKSYFNFQNTCGSHPHIAIWWSTTSREQVMRKSVSCSWFATIKKCCQERLELRKGTNSCFDIGAALQLLLLVKEDAPG